MNSLPSLVRRQTSQNDTFDSACDPIGLVSGGILIINETFSLTLSENAVFKPPCTPGAQPETADPSAIRDAHDPFYASTSPQMYAIATATVISYLLVIILFITPRTFFVPGRTGTAIFLGRRGMISGSYGSSSSVIGVGGRPWLQKVAALSVAVSLTIASADSFRVAKEQYDLGYMDSSALTNEVINGLEIRIVRVISSTFLWLAQVQTLIRLFPRHKEKVTIKWAGFALIVLDTVFTILNSFSGDPATRTRITRPGGIVDAIPALSYLFELSLSLLYAAWVIFYSLSKHRFAFFHAKMRNICLVALLSFVAMLIPVVFFVLDVSKPNIAGWGEYIRWVGAAAASVVVWEWVERIEALERDERKDGILGREIFDGDEMLEVTPSEEVDLPGQRRRGQGPGAPPGGSGTSSGLVGGGVSGGANDRNGAGAHLSSWGAKLGLSNPSSKARVMFQAHLPQVRRRKDRCVTYPKPMPAAYTRNNNSTPPPLSTTPVSRADTTSAASTVYRVRYHSTESPSPVPSVVVSSTDGDTAKVLSPMTSPESIVGGSDLDGRQTVDPSADAFKLGLRWLAVSNPFKRRRGSPPQEVATAQSGTYYSAEGRAEAATTAAVADERDWRSNVVSRFQSLVPAFPRARRDSLPSSAGLLVTVIPPRTQAIRSLSYATTAFEQPRSGSSLKATEDTWVSDQTLPVMVIPARPRASRSWSSPHLSDQGTAESGNPQSWSLSDGDTIISPPELSPSGFSRPSIMYDVQTAPVYEPRNEESAELSRIGSISDYTSSPTQLSYRLSRSNVSPPPVDTRDRNSHFIPTTSPPVLPTMSGALGPISLTLHTNTSHTLHENRLHKPGSGGPGSSSSLFSESPQRMSVESHE